MKIAVLGPSPVPFTIGGVENLLWKLCETINQKTNHQAEFLSFFPISKGLSTSLFEDIVMPAKEDL